nr:MFS transporter [Christensenella tenuis]
MVAVSWTILGVLIFMPFMAMLDSTIVNVALPVMATDLSVEMESVQMVVTVYLVAVVASILLFGRLGDIHGKGRIFMMGTAIFTIGSLLSGLSHSLNMLIIARVVEGIGAAAATANSQGLITEVFPANERGRALGISGISVALGTMLGPVIGGLIVTYLSWNYIFLINVPIGVIGFLLALKFLPRDTSITEKLDYRGAIFLAAAVILFVYALTEGESVGYGTYYIILSFAAAGIFAIIFILFERKGNPPLLDLSLFKNPLLTLSVLCAMILYFAINAINIIQPFYIEDVLKIDPGSTGLIMMSISIVMGITSPIAGSVSDKIGSPKIMLVGLATLTIGIALLSTLTATESVVKLVVYLCIIGFGAGAFSAPATSLIMSVAPKNKLGITGSVNMFVRNFGSVMGISILTSMLYAVMSSRIGYKVDGFVSGQPNIFVDGMQAVYIVGACLLCVSVALTIALVVIYKKKKAK